jgi:hypothetical protein
VEAPENAVRRVSTWQVPLHDGDTGGDCGFLGIADECSHLSAALGQLLKNVAPNGAGRAGNDNTHQDSA